MGKLGVQTNSFNFCVAKGWNKLDRTVVQSGIDVAWMDKRNKFTIEQLIETNDQEQFRY